MPRVFRAVSLLCAILLIPSVGAIAQEVGPANGSLVVVGGAMRSPEILERFLELAGGPHAKIVVIPTAGGADQYDNSFGGLRPFQRAGVEVVLIHTNDRAEADSEEFVQPIREADGVWFTGGRQWRLADSYLGTRTEKELWAVLERGGVIGGSSAGATIQGSYLAWKEAPPRAGYSRRHYPTGLCRNAHRRLDAVGCTEG